MNVDELADRTGLDARQLRYVIEYAIVPPIDMLMPGRGTAREFDAFTGFCIALAAILRAIGLRRTVVAEVMETVMQMRRPKAVRGPIMMPLVRNVFQYATTSVLRIGDGVNVRIDSAPTRLEGLVDYPLELPWTQIETGAVLAEGYEPLGEIRVRLDVLARRVRGG